VVAGSEQAIKGFAEDFGVVVSKCLLGAVVEKDDTLRFIHHDDWIVENSDDFSQIGGSRWVDHSISVFVVRI